MKRLALLCVCAGLAAACGKTVFSTERFACSTSGDCADGFECRGQECARPSSAPDAGLDAGVRTDGGAGAGCASTTSCADGLTCTDGVCCLTACAAPCDSCNQPGAEGTCLVRPAGASAPSCGGYACDGTSTACASSCALGLACNPGFSCVAPTCGRCWSAVTNDFSLVNDPTWTLSGASIGTGQLTISVTSRNGQPTTSSALSVESLLLSGCGLTFELGPPPVPVAGYQGLAELRADDVTRRPAFGWQFDTRGLLVAWELLDGGTGEQVVVPAGTALPRWLRIEEAGGEVRWRSASTTTFTTLKTLAHGESLGGLKLEFSGSFPAQAGSERVTFGVDSINVGP